MDSPTPASLCALIEAVARSQDRAAFAMLFGHFAPRVKGYLMRLGANAAMAEELAQEAMLLVWRKAPLFDAGKATASTWVFTIARNLRIDAIRRERRPEIDPAELSPEPERAADAGMVRDEDDSRVREAITSLPKEQALVIELSFFADKPHSLIAQELGLPLGTVKSRLRLAMARIRAALGEEDAL
ncbi:MAG TPA: sigma-70 family RNA polymerase sigma factor [Rhizomicrobium sp.]|jgi:RNA polymerase sigma-70 factor (ECF subfamily)|nr:sigma-70 family RNA polymerase sigma factor [Rhizomicrobium sp.]